MAQVRSRIIGTGLGTPSRSVSNAALSESIDTSDEWITSRTGIRSRFLIDPAAGETNASLGLQAARQALHSAKLTPTDIDLVIYCTMTADTLMPNTASRVIGELGLTRAAGFDLNTACTGFVTGMATADAYLRAGLYKKILVVGAEVMSAFLDWQDRRTCVLFGDGAGAVVVEAFDCQNPLTESCVIGAQLFVQPDPHNALTIAGGGSAVPAHDARFQTTHKPFVTMNGAEVFKLGSRGMAEAAKRVVEDFGFTVDDVRWLVPHQANMRMLEMIAKVLGMPMDRVFSNLDRWGNTTAGTIPIALAEMNARGLLNKGDLIVLDAFGGGFNYGAVLVRW